MRMLIAGEWMDSESGDCIEVINPATEETLDTVPAGTPREVDCAAAAAYTAFDGWRRVAAADRAQLLHQAAAKMREHFDELAHLLTLEEGKPVPENEEEIDRLIATWTVNRTPEEVMSVLQTAGVPAGIVTTGEDLIEHDLGLKHRHVYRELEHPEIGTYHGVAPSYEFSKCPVEVERAPLMGEHNESVFEEILGMSDEEIKELILEEVIE